MGLRAFTDIDVISSAGLERISALVEQMPRSFEIGATQCRPGSVTATLYFADADVFTVDRCLTDVLEAAMCAEALTLNLVEARRVITELVRATASFTGADAPSEALFKLLDVRASACRLVGLDPAGDWPALDDG